MSERTTIGGTVYETVGSSSSNLLLKCNGTARIQWGTKLIDLIKNGKLASGDSSLAVSIISDLSEIKYDGFYILNTDKSSELWIRKDGKQYNISGTDLYVSANTKQNINAEQKKQALENIGIYYSTLEEVRSAGIQHGLVYVLEDNNLYVIKDGVISEFEAKLKTVAIEKEEEYGEIINSSVQIVLSILDDEYLILKNQIIKANYDVVIDNSAKLCSEGANELHGYRLFMDGDSACLDVDTINVRNGIVIPEYIEVDFRQLQNAFVNNKLEPHKWYLIKDYQSPWKLPSNNYNNNRPILVRALTESSFYKEGFLFKDRRVSIQYDPTYTESIALLNSNGIPTGEFTNARGRIIWMKDTFNNEANFDFLDYTDAFDNPLATLYKVYEDDSLDLSIFPTNSYNNKLTVYDLKGITLKESIFTNDNVVEVDFTSSVLNMNNNNIECRGLVVSCENFYNNNLKEICKVHINSDFTNNDFTSVYTSNNNIVFDLITNNNELAITSFTHKIDSVILQGFQKSTLNSELTSSKFGIIYNSTIEGSINNSSFEDVSECLFYCQFNKVNFRSLSNCVFNTGILHDITCFGDLSGFTFSSEKEEYVLLYDTYKTKEIYVNDDGTIDIVSVKEQSFIRGMIIMHSGIGGIPKGWAICDGGTYEYDGIKSTTPDLRGRFIKASNDVFNVGVSTNLDVNENNEIILKKEHLPEHTHPHKPHKHTFEGSDSDTVNITINALTNSTSQSAIVNVEGGTSGYSGDSVSGESVSDSDTVSITISGDTSETISEEDTQIWENKAIKIEPNYYSLIFIMKL